MVLLYYINFLILQQNFLLKSRGILYEKEKIMNIMENYGNAKVI